MVPVLKKLQFIVLVDMILSENSNMEFPVFYIICIVNG